MAIPNKALALPVIVLALSVLACRTGNPERKLNLYPTPTSEATQTPYVVEVTTSPPPPIFVQITTTPVPTLSIQLCVSAVETVNLRPSASDRGYPITQLENGDEVVDLGGRQGNWIYVQAGDEAGWINKKYLEACK